MKAQNKGWEPCPRCESKKVKSQGPKFYFFLGLITMSISIWLLIIPPIGIAGIFVGIILMIASPFLQKTCACQDCKLSWKYPHKDTDIITS